MTEQPYTAEAEQRFWARVDADGDCWEWIGPLGTSGYGKVAWRADGRSITASAHRLAYELLVGPIPDGLMIDHLCRNRRCVNPDHMEPVTALVNQRRGFAPAYSRLRAAAITHCPQGHPYDEANTYWRGPRRWRECRACHRIRREAWDRRRQESRRLARELAHPPVPINEESTDG